MKRAIICGMIFVIAVFMLIGCELSSPELDLSTIKTVKDAVAANDSDEWQSTAYEEWYVYVFSAGGKYYRAYAPMDESTFDAIIDLDYEDEDYDAKYDELVYPLEISKIENLSDMIPSKSELKALVGKTGADLLADDWYCMGYNLDEMQFYMNKDPFEYIITFDGSLEMSDDFDEYEAIAPLTVKSVEFFGLGDAAYIEDYTD